MKSYLLIVMLTGICQLGFSQNSYVKKGSVGNAQQEKPEVKKDDKLLYGPLPYRTLQETIGETYLVLPIDSSFRKHGYMSLYKSGKTSRLSADEMENKLLKLTKIENNEMGYFTDDSGIEYTSNMVNGKFVDMVPTLDIDNARKLFIGKTLWLNDAGIATGEIYDALKQGTLKPDRFEPLIITDIVAGNIAEAPVIFIIKTSKGETGFIPTNLSGTNTNRKPNFLFTNQFYTTDPKLKYKFTPQHWQLIKQNKIVIGMPADAVYLVKGYPDDVNKTITGSTVTEQWVYGSTYQQYYYFTNGKLTAISK